MRKYTSAWSLYKIFHTIRRWVALVDPWLCRCAVGQYRGLLSPRYQILCLVNLQCWPRILAGTLPRGLKFNQHI